MACSKFVSSRLFIVQVKRGCRIGRLPVAQTVKSAKA